MKKATNKPNKKTSQKPIPASRPEIINQGRLSRIDIMVGFAMLMVVLGHLNIDPRVPSWYTHGLIQWIYSFHMEVFIFLSGFLIRYSYRGVTSLKDYITYVWRKFKKFFLGFIIIGIAVSLASSLITHGEMLSDLRGNMRMLFLYPMWSQASFLWYIYVLFGFYIISPLYFKMPVWLQRALCVVALLLPMLQASHFLAAERFCKFTCFYCLGVQCAQGLGELKNIKTWSWSILSLPFVAFSIWMLVVGFQTQESQMPFLHVITGFMALPFVYLLAMGIDRCHWLSSIFVRISKDCYWIYILQMFVIWGLKYALFAIGFDASEWFFIVFVPSAVVLAIGLPIALASLWKTITKGLLRKQL